jgi:hypothetical protein
MNKKLKYWAIFILVCWSMLRISYFCITLLVDNFTWMRNGFVEIILMFSFLLGSLIGTHAILSDYGTRDTRFFD